MKRWLKYVKPYKKFFIIGPICMIVEVIGEILLPSYLAIIINAATDGTLTYGTNIGVCLLAAFTAIVMMLGGIGGSYFGAKASVNFSADLRHDIFSKVQNYSFANIDKFSAGSLITRLTNDVTQLQNFVNMLLRMALRSPGMLIGALIMAISLKPQLALVFLVTIPVMLLFIFLIIKYGFPKFGVMQKKIDSLNNTVQENITNVRVVKSFVREDFEQKKFERSNKNLKSAAMSAMKVMIFMQPVITIFMNLTTAAIIWIGGNLVLGRNMEVGELSAFITYASQILFSLMMIMGLLMISSRALASARRISEVLDEKIDITDLTAANKDKIVTDGKIEFQDVTFRYYKNSEETVLNKINLVIEPGSTVGIIGSTGCGKSTLVSLIPRLYDTDEGQVLVDGVNVKDYSIYNLREGIGMVLQKNVLFSGSILDNLRWGDQDATLEEVEIAASYAQADKFVKTFPNQYDMKLDQGGTNVSGGQKQRLCIARALMKKPKILILDDSTSAVDTATEAQIQKAFKAELAGSTKIIIAQRISSVKEADQIVVMNEGTITGIGTHEQLIQNNTEYQEIYYSQIDRKENA